MGKFGPEERLTPAKRKRLGVDRLTPELADWLDSVWPELEAIGGARSLRYRFVDTLPLGGKWAAKVFNQVIYVRRGWRSHIDPADRHTIRVLLGHEPVHVLQQEQYGWWGFLLRYVGSWFANGCRYRRISFEVEAYDHDEKILALYLEQNPCGVKQWR